MAAIGVGLATVAVLGPLAAGVVDCRVTETLRNQTIDLDAVSLLVVAPLAFLAALLTRSCSSRSTWLCSLPDGPWPSRGGTRSRPSGSLARRDRLVGCVVLPLLTFLAFSRYIPSLADWMRSQPEDAGYLAGPTFSWAIAMLDLGIFLPAAIAACVGLVRGAPWAQKALYTVVCWFGLVGPAVAGMAIAMYVNGDPNASAGSAVFMTTLGLVFAALAIVVFKPLLARGSHDASNSDLS